MRVEPLARSSRHPLSIAGTSVVPAFCVALVAGAAAVVSFANLSSGSLLTDELAYISSAREYLSGNYTSALEHPFLGKWVIGAALTWLGVSDTSARLPSAVCGFLATGVVTAWGWRSGGPLTGTLAGLLFVANPYVRHVARQALLDAPLLLFFTLALALAGVWLERGRAGWLLGAAVAAGLALGAKLTAGMLPPIFAGAWAWGCWTQRRRPPASEMALLAGAALLSAAVFLATYGPALTEAPRIWDEMVRVWAAEQAAGHRIRLAGQVYDQPPWWAYLFWLADAGPAGWVTLAAAIAGVAAAVQRRTADGVYWALALLVPLALLSVGLSFKMERYGAVLAPGMALLGSLALTRSPVRRAGGVRSMARAAAVLLAALAAGSAARASVIQEPTEYHAAGLALTETPTVLTSGAAPLLLVWGYTDAAAWYLGARYHIVGGYTTEALQGSYEEAAVVLVDPRMAQRYPDDPLARYLAARSGAFRVVEAAGVTLYQRRAP